MASLRNGISSGHEPLLKGKLVLAAIRQKAILSLLENQTVARVSELATIFEVTEVTVRKDLDILHKKNLLQKIRGGATIVNGRVGTYEATFDELQFSQRPEKKAVARLASQFVSQFQTLALMGGTTVSLLSEEIICIPRLTVATNSLRVADFLYRHGRPDLNLIISGGQRTKSDSLVGPVTEAFFSQFHFDVVFLGAHRMSFDGGFSSPSLQEAHTNRTVIDRAQQVVLLADHSKWASPGFASFGPLRVANKLVIDGGCPPKVLEILREHISEVFVAEVET